jgi:hypothetical protein
MANLIESYVATPQGYDTQLLKQMDYICRYGLESLDQDDLASFVILLLENVFEPQQAYIEENVLCDGTGSLFWHHALSLSNIAKIQLCAAMSSHLVERMTVDLQSRHGL